MKIARRCSPARPVRKRPSPSAAHLQDTQGGQIRDASAPQQVQDRLLAALKRVELARGEERISLRQVQFHAAAIDGLDAFNLVAHRDFALPIHSSRPPLIALSWHPSDTWLRRDQYQKIAGEKGGRSRNLRRSAAGSPPRRRAPRRPARLARRSSIAPRRRLPAGLAARPRMPGRRSRPTPRSQTRLTTIIAIAKTEPPALVTSKASATCGP